MESTWLAQAKRLQALASTGLHFCTDDFERERLEEIAHIAHSMLAQLGQVPLERITGLVSDFAQRYSTPMIDVRGALIEDERILLVREATDGCWALPGGYADIGLSAAENIVKELREEAGLSVTARTLYSVTHKAKGLYRPDVRDFYKLYFLCERTDQAAPTAGFETTDVGFFRLDELPPLSRGRTIESDLEAAFAFHRGEITQTLFD
ncbi:NUDIX domain-containing protein [Pseudomonas proteolytica]|jgi:ADP-ribose pyrophosphatase YjhB (NUDIX family)|uniref:NUDIX domain-containing protein n=1 Tax=Pseudomonas proteolytica TaxID=219574 RepID=A0AAW5AAR5_9PSED|nr:MULTISPECIES: NUDIX hydrolase [Pseudomonas]MBC3338231.1 NUDIX hydrolase [Pseudomonas proteolytica]MCF5059675.1 NUDIX domain-containing protein [Pseudomonas proteolytica]MCF5100428.1 NUDIX domain-containing protein [Pseudomonas proteolytica]MDF3163531.1 NUDIX hydrolase [Pseudomonas proteolytica]NMZ03353.1 NUDIX hydrolase [Pseudomonas proteolytica]